MAMMHLVVYALGTEYVATMTDYPKKFSDVIFSEEISESSEEEEVIKRARIEARKRGIAYVQGLD